MADNISQGFLSQLGLNIPNKNAVFQQATGSQPIPGGGNNASFMNLGLRLGNLIGSGAAPFIEGGIDTFRNRKEQEGGFLRNFLTNSAEALEDQKNTVVAQQLGIDVETLKERERVRDQLKNFTPTASDPLDQQIETAMEAARLSNDPEVKMQALSMVNALRTQKQELRKAGLENELDELQLEGGRFKEVFFPGEEQGHIGEMDFANRGVWMDRGSGPELIPFGQVSLNPKIPRGRTVQPETTGQMLRRGMGTSTLNAVKMAIVDGKAQMERMGAVMDIVSNVDPSTLSTAGRFIETVDQVARNANNIARAIGGSLEELTYNGKEVTNERGLVRHLSERAKRGEFDQLIPIPETFRGNSAQEQGYRANIMELAYLNARLMEPSNRGLSDTDIENALRRLNANSANPEVIMNRMATMVVDASRHLEDLLDVHYGTFSDVMDESEFEESIGGEALIKYRNAHDQFLDRWSVVRSPDSAVVGREDDALLDVPPNPTGTGGRTPASDLSDDEILNDILSR